MTTTGTLLARFAQYELRRMPTADITIWQGGLYVGVAFPAKISDPQGRWYARAAGTSAVPFTSCWPALAYLAPGCPQTVAQAVTR